MYNNIHQHGIFYNQLKKNDGKIIGMYPPSSTPIRVTLSICALPNRECTLLYSTLLYSTQVMWYILFSY